MSNDGTCCNDFSVVVCVSTLPLDVFSKMPLTRVELQLAGSHLADVRMRLQILYGVREDVPRVCRRLHSGQDNKMLEESIKWVE